MNLPAASYGVSKISLRNLCVYGGTNPPYPPAVTAPRGGVLNPNGATLPINTPPPSEEEPIKTMYIHRTLPPFEHFHKDDKHKK